MGFINKDQMDARLSEQNNLSERLKLPVRSAEDKEPELDTTKFKNDGTERKKPSFSSELRALIGATALVSGSKEAAEIFDCSVGTAGKLSRGESSTAIDLVAREEKNSKLRADIYENLGTIREAAREKLLKVLNIIDDTSLDAIPNKDKLRIAAGAANQLASVIDKTIEKGKDFGDSRSAHLHLYAPEQQEIGKYKVVTVNKVPEDNVIDVGLTGEAANGSNG